MIKQLLSAGVISLAVILTMGGSATSAIEIQPRTICEGEDCSEAVVASDEPTEAIIDCEANPDDVKCVEIDETTAPSNEGEITEPGDINITETVDLETGGEEEIADDTEEEAPMWPMYISLGALGAAIIVFILFSIFGGKKNK